MNLLVKKKLTAFLKIACYVLLLILTFDNVMMYSGGKPLVSDLNPLLYMVSISTIFIVPILLAIKLLRFIFDKEYTRLLTVVVLVFIVVILAVITNKIVSKKAISKSYDAVVMVLSGSRKSIGNNYDLDVKSEARADFNGFRANFDLSAIKLYSAATQYSRYQYIVIPKSNTVKPFTVIIQSDDGRTHIIVTNEGIQKYMENYTR